MKPLQTNKIFQESQNTKILPKPGYPGFFRHDVPEQKVKTVSGGALA